MDNQFLLNTIFQPKHIDSLLAEVGSDDLDYKKQKLIESEFSDLVDVMRQEKWLPLPSINVLMTLLWRLVGNHITPVAVNPNIQTLSFWCESRQNNSLAVIMVPENWHYLLVENAHLQMGAMAFVASQAKDYWNHKFVAMQKNQNVVDRAWSTEVELLQYFVKTVPDFKLNEYQDSIMKKYPKGIASVDAHYVGREYDGAFPPFPVDVNLYK